MKKFIILFTFTLTGTFSFGQTNVYHPFPDSNSVWVESLYYLNGNMCWVFDDYNLYISGDTTIGSFIYHKLYKNGHISGFCPPPEPPPNSYDYYGEYWGAFRQDSAGKKVYLNQGWNGTDALAYDFNLNVGDTLHPSCLSDFNYVLSIDSVLVGSQYNKRFWLSDGLNNNYAALIEGIGNTNGAFGYLAFPFEAGSNLWCVKINNQTVYPIDSINSCTVINRNSDINLDNQISIYPNPFSLFTIINVNINLRNVNLTLYNALGQKVKIIKNISEHEIPLKRDNLPCGVYFIHLTQGNKTILKEKVIIAN